MIGSESPPNPLPIHDANAELQRKSIHALHAVTDGGGFLLRGVQNMDYGVDATLEIVVGERATNFIAQVQIKAAQSAEMNQDGSTSKAIEVSNFNYLLNGSCPIYLFYSAAHNRFWYAWAFDELRRLETENPKWKEQKTVSIRFSLVLTPASAKEIQQRIVREATSRRDVIDTLARYAAQERAKFAIDPQTFATQNGEQAYQLLIDSGFALVSHGMWREMMAQVDLLTSCRKQEPRICLIVAYAYYIQGRYLSVLASCSDAHLRISELGRSDVDALETIRNACDCQIGKITRDEYTRRRVRAANDAGASLQCRLEAVRFQFLGEPEDPRRSELLRQLKSIAVEILGDANGSEPFRLQTRLHVAYAEGWECQMTLSQAIGRLQFQLKMKKSWALPDRAPVSQAMVDLVDWEQRMRQLICDIEKEGISWLYAEARRTALLVRTALVGMQRFNSTFLNLGERPSRTQIEVLLSEAKEVSKIFAAAGNIEGEMRAKIAEADLYELVDDSASAKTAAQEVKRVAEALGLAELQILADHHLDGTTLLQTTEIGIRKNRESDQDVGWSEMSEADIDDYAQRFLRATQLPSDRLPIIRKDVEGMKLIATERLSWCRHIEQLQLLAHTWHPSTAYASPTRWTGKCVKHGYESLRDSADSPLVIANFKRSYCDGCPDRSPKRDPATNAAATQ